jgi:hypothetical protein
VVFGPSGVNARNIGFNRADHSARQRVYRPCNRFASKVEIAGT